MCGRFRDRFKEWDNVVEVIGILEEMDQFVPKGIEICMVDSRRHDENNPLLWAPK